MASSPKLELASRRAEASALRTREILAALDDAHALAATPGGRLDQHRVADRRGLLRKTPLVLIVAVVAGHERNSSLAHDPLRFGFRAHGANRRRRRADEGQSGGGDRSGEGFVLRQKAVTRMNRLRAGRSGDGDDRVAVEIALARGAAPSRRASSQTETWSAPASASE